MKKTDKTNYVFTAKMIFSVILALASVIFLVSGYYTAGIEGIIITTVVWILLTIQEIKIGLLQDISNKIKKDEE